MKKLIILFLLFINSYCYADTYKYIFNPMTGYLDKVNVTISSATYSTNADTLDNLDSDDFYIKIDSITIGTTQDFYSRWQIWDYMPNSILRLGSLRRNFDTYDVSSEGIVVYGDDPGGNMDNFVYGYARIKPYRFGLYTSSNTGEGYKFLCDLQTDSFYLKTNAEIPVLNITRETMPPRLDFYGNIYSTQTVSAPIGLFDNIILSTGGLQAQIDLISQATNYLETNRVTKLIAGTTNIVLNPAGGQGEVTIAITTGEGGGGDMFKAIDGANISISTTSLQTQMNVRMTNPADTSFLMENFGIRNSSYVYISTGVGQGYLQISDKYIVVSGTTSTAINAAIGALGASGGDIYLPAGNYSVNSRINLANNMTLSGAGSATRLHNEVWANWTTPAHTLYVQNKSNVIIRDLKIDGNYANTGQNYNLIEISSCTQITVDNVYAVYSDQHGIHSSGTNILKINKCNVDYNDSGGIYVDGYNYEAGQYSGGYETSVIGNTARGNYDGIRFNYTRAVNIMGNYMRANTHYNIECDQTNYGLTILNNAVIGDGIAGGIHFYSGSFVCMGNYIYNLAGRGIHADTMSGGAILNNSIDTTGYESIYIGDGLSQNVNIIGNSLRDAANTRNTVNIVKANNCKISENNCSTSASGKSERAFYIQVGTNNVISNNLTSGHDTAAIEVLAGCVGTQVKDNDFGEAVKVIDNGLSTCLQITQNCKWGFGVSSPTVTLDVSGGSLKVSTATVSAVFYLPFVATLPVTGVSEGAFFYCTTDKKQWHSTETVTGAWSYVTP